MWKKLLNRKYRFYLMSVALFVVILGLRWWAREFPLVFLRLYTNGINKWMIQGMSRFFGLLGFSVFEVLILLLLITGTYLLWRYKWRGIVACVGGLVFVYSAFMLMWGLNYERPPVSLDFDLNIRDPQASDLQALYLKLIDLANVTRGEVSESEKGIFVASSTEDVSPGYDILMSRYGVFGGDYGRYKEVASSRIMSWARIAGIYGVFTGEPNVNSNIPDVARLFTITHESAHQRGVAHEDETNFVAFMACVLHPDVDYRYSGYFNALLYVREALIDEGEFMWVRWQDQFIDDGVVRDFNNLSKFWEERESWLSGVARSSSDVFMNFHQTSEYVRVVDFLVAYFDIAGNET